MIRNYLKIIFRNLVRNRSYAFINITGLAIGITCTALIFLWVEDELNFDAYFPNKNQIYKVKNSQTYEGKTYVFDATAGPLAAALKAEISGVKNTARSTWGDQLLVTQGDKAIYSQGNFVDPAFLEMMHLEFLSGTSARAFNQLHAIVLTETSALKFFGSRNVSGKILRINNSENYVVSGVVKDLPANSTFYFEWLAPFEAFELNQPWVKEWSTNGIITYVELRPDADANAINKRLNDYAELKSGSKTSKLSIYPMSHWRLYDTFDDNGKEAEGAVKYVRLFSIIAWIILLIACINFMNLSTASSEKRACEVGVRKALGSAKRSLIIQFLSESLIMSAISALIAVGIVYLLLPSFNTLIRKQLSLHLFSATHLFSLAVTTFLCGFIAGSYPAFYLSSFNPVAVLKGSGVQQRTGAGFIRKGLVVLQFTASITLIICTVMIYRQVQYVKARDIGYDKSGLLYTALQGKLAKNFSGVKNDLLKIPGVTNACLSSNQVLQLGSNSGDFKWPGKDASKSVLITIEIASPEYINTMGLRIRSGRDFYPDIASDSTNVIINETLAEMIGKKNVLGTQIYQSENTKYTIVGVIRDFIYNSMYDKAQPMILFSNSSNVNFMSVRLNASGNLPATLSAIESVIKSNNPGYPFEYRFVDEQFERLFRTETLINKLSGIFAILAVFISCLGLLGLTSYIAARRAKEISIRKVLGASVQLLTLLLTRDFMKLVLIACALAFLLAGYFMRGWLQNYEYHTQLSWWIFLLAGSLALLIALVTIGFKAIKTALTNPIKNLRAE